MAKIYLSYNHQDQEFVAEVATRLKGGEHIIAMDVEAISAGQNWRSTLIESLKSADVFVVFLSNTSLQSQSVLGEIGAARAYASESDRMLLIPVIIDQLAIPNVIQDLHAIYQPDRDVEKIIERIERAISAFIGRRAAQEEHAEATARRIETTSAEFIDEAIRSLGRREARDRASGTFWYVAGFIALVLGIVFAIDGVKQLGQPSDRSWPDFAILSLKAIVIIGLLGACARYAFTLGKSYVSESLKSADRMHAIEFGKFYLRSFGHQATWPEIKEVFQHWNIDRNSSFSAQDASQIDPKIIESIVEISRLVAGKKADK